MFHTLMNHSYSNIPVNPVQFVNHMSLISKEASLELSFGVHQAEMADLEIKEKCSLTQEEMAHMFLVKSF